MGTGKGVMNRMETTDIVIHKGEKEDKYQVYVEDYVISYLKNYGAAESGTIFFYGARNIKEKKYYIYGAGRKEQITYFAKYELLEEISCRMGMDMPVFSIREETGIYELAGYHVFYQTNEAMQNYMVEQRKEAQHGREKEKTQFDEKLQRRINQSAQAKLQEKIPAANQGLGKRKSGIMTVQLAAIFVVLIAIIINSTNSYSKLKELNQAAVEVFFAMENQDASKEYNVDASLQAEQGKEEDKGQGESSGTDAPDMQTEGNILRLEDLDDKFEEENQAVKQEEAEEENADETDTDESETENGEEEKEGESENEMGGKAEEGTNEEEQETDSAQEETSQSQQAFARNFAEYYRIEKGDTLYTISIKIYGDTSKVNEICELNQISDPDNIKYGQKILLP